MSQLNAANEDAWPDVPEAVLDIASPIHDFGDMFATFFNQTGVVIGELAVVGLLAWLVWSFNRLVRARNLMREGWSGIDVQLKRRHNLIPGLVECVRGYSAHEKGVLEEVTRLRGRAEDESDRRTAAHTENALTDQLKQLFALAESYPDLKADRSYRQLMDQLSEIEDQIQYSRRYYNGAVRDYNIRVESFPGNIVAGLFGFKPAPFFEIEIATERQVPKVDLGGAAAPEAREK